MSGAWWWVRHGPTHERAMCGWRDVPVDLSDLAALDRLASYLPEDAVIVSSDLIRARATADAIARGRTRLPDARGLREFDFGVWDGMAFDAVAERDPELSRAYWETPGDIAPPGGESWNAATARIAIAVAGIRDLHPQRDIVAVAHIGVILSQLSQVTGRAPADTLAQKIDNLSVTRLDDRGGMTGPVNLCP